MVGHIFIAGGLGIVWKIFPGHMLKLSRFFYPAATSVCLSFLICFSWLSKSQGRESRFSGPMDRRGLLGVVSAKSRGKARDQPAERIKFVSPSSLIT